MSVVCANKREPVWVYLPQETVKNKVMQDNNSGVLRSFEGSLIGNKAVKSEGKNVINNSGTFLNLKHSW